ncbi:MAG TPA: hypothetical protein GXZ40_01790 [Bacteroidales bacterium]|jgi:hypothetical protein|nr:hypothetical protein [Bacteroidales bacterium]
MSEEQAYLDELLQNAVNAVYEEDRCLLHFSKGCKVGLEQAFVFRTGIHLSNLLQGTCYETLDLDSEYNKNHGNAKKSRRFPNGLRPDLIIHRRDSNEENKLVVEFKGWWNNDINTDLKKLEDLTSPKEKYKYLIGVFVKIGKTKPTYRYFINGKEHLKEKARSNEIISDNLVKTKINE